MSIEGHCTLILNIAQYDDTGFAALFTRMATEGITFSTLTEEQGRRADWLEQFTNLDNDTRQGNIGTPRQVEEMPERLVFMGVVPESLFLATVGNQYVGYTTLIPEEADNQALRQGWTGVCPAYRRRGIATALKALGVTYAKSHGYLRIITEPRIANMASVGMSLKIGFQYKGQG